MEKKQKILVGIPSFAGPSAETAFDYMRMWYHFGRRMPEYDFYFAPIVKSEQYRARNRMMRMARIMSADYLLMLDDDHVIDWRDTDDSNAYDFLKKLLAHNKAVIGALYYHRGGELRPVLMEAEEGKEGYRYLLDDEITGGLQEVAVQGGGCLLIKAEVFEKMEEPYFLPEHQVGKGTDVQFCEKARAMGYKVWCDTSVVLGHVLAEHTVVTPKNREMLYLMKQRLENDTGDYIWNRRLKEFVADVKEYTGKSYEELLEDGVLYNDTSFPNFPEEAELRDEYYKNLGQKQLARQLYYHSNPNVAANDSMVVESIKKNQRYRILDFGCGAGIVGFDLLRTGHYVDFVDIEGAYSYEFLKWRIRKHEFMSRASFSISGPYDVLLLLDIVEHLENWKEVLEDLLIRVSNKGIVLCNFLANDDYENVEHVFMDKKLFIKFMTDRGFLPFSNSVWVKHQVGG